jgi:16S rRNA (guanine527-N7)-methyltransferase
VFRELLLRRVSGFCQLSDSQLQQLEQHHELMLRWNKVINLTRIEKVEDAVDRHYAESLFVAANLPPGPITIADIGSGAGFPGLPIAILRPDVRVTLIESHKRKAVFLKEASRGLANVAVVSRRAEEVKESFDWVVSRAVSWEEIRKIGLRLAPKLALLGSAASADRVIPLPWSPERKLLFVSRETSKLHVPRETM